MLSAEPLNLFAFRHFTYLPSSVPTGGSNSAYQCVMSLPGRIVYVELWWPVRVNIIYRYDNHCINY